MKKRFLLFAYRASWKGIMGKKLVWFEVVGFACLRGEQRTVSAFLFLWTGVARKSSAGPSICIHTPTCELVPWAESCPQPWSERSDHLKLWARASGRGMLWGPLGIGELQRSWQYVPCANEARWVEECISCSSWAVFTWAVWMWIKNKPRKTFVGEGRSSKLVKTDNPCAVSRGRGGCVLRTPGKKNKNWLWHAVSKKKWKGGGGKSEQQASLQHQLTNKGLTCRGLGEGWGSKV